MIQFSKIQNPRDTPSGRLYIREEITHQQVENYTKITTIRARIRRNVYDRGIEPTDDEIMGWIKSNWPTLSPGRMEYIFEQARLIKDCG